MRPHHPQHPLLQPLTVTAVARPRVLRRRYLYVTRAVKRVYNGYNMTRADPARVDGDREREREEEKKNRKCYLNRVTKLAIPVENDSIM